jgi:predicted DCC family thiol-disulfide oxidoreductase YuxK
MQPSQSANSIVLFDGVCNLCNASIQFIIARDPHSHFQFASLQSENAQALLKQYGISMQLDGKDDSVILIEDGKVYTHSTASLRVARKLNSIVRLGYALIVIPEGIRNFVYRIIARNRYRWFGKQDVCWMPTPELSKRFMA